MIRSHCVMCSYPMRPAQVPIAERPGTRQHQSNGLCRKCFKVERLAGNIPESTGKRGRPRRDPGVETMQYAYMFDERAASAALEGWLEARRRRLARQGVMA